MATIFDCSDQTQLLTGMRLARAAIGRGELIVLPTDTVYGVAADAFHPVAVRRLLEAKGRTRQSPPPVLIPDVETLDALAAEVPDEVRALIAAFWPGGLTVILRAQASLNWDLGDTEGTVAVRIPDHRLALELLTETGPLAVSSANLTGQPAATTAAEAERMLGSSVAVYLDGGAVGLADKSGPNTAPSTGPNSNASTIVDATGLLRPGGQLEIVRHGVIPAEAIHRVLASGSASSAAASDLTVPGPTAADHVAPDHPAPPA
ncbi:MAG: L-threonylcarbamoyladenylate synthase [Microbacteriaceae bacterium]